MLVSLKAASLGVNLVSANHVVLLGERLNRLDLLPLLFRLIMLSHPCGASQPTVDFHAFCPNFIS